MMDEWGKSWKNLFVMNAARSLIAAQRQITHAGALTYQICVEVLIFRENASAQIA